MNDSGFIVGIDAAPANTAVYWSPSDGYLEHLLPLGPSEQILIMNGVGDNGWMIGATNYADGTSGVPILETPTSSEMDLRALIPQGTGWALSEGLYILADRSVICAATPPNGSTVGYAYVRPM
jgi:hypothetical protein